MDLKFVFWGLLLKDVLTLMFGGFNPAEELWRPDGTIF